jgi:hypothetical protein
MRAAGDMGIAAQRGSHAPGIEAFGTKAVT